MPPDWFKVLAEVVGPTIPPVIVAVPPDCTSSDVRLALLVKVPFTVVAAAVPPVRLALPVVIVRACRLAFAVRFPPLTVVVPPTIPPLWIVVLPPVKSAKPVTLATLMTVPSDCVRFATVPPVRLTVPDTTRACREALAVKWPKVLTVVVPPTIAPELKTVIPS